MAIGDLNGDSKPDLAVASTSSLSSHVSELWNATSHAPDDSYSTIEDAALTVAGPGVLGNDADPDGKASAVAWRMGPAPPRVKSVAGGRDVEADGCGHDDSWRR